MKKLFMSLTMVALLALLFCGCECEYHGFQKETIKEPTCTEDGVLLKSCRECDYTEEEAIPAAHDFQEDSVVQEHTCFEDGIWLYKCTRCGETEERTHGASHLYVDNECINCGAVRADITADTWYELTNVPAFRFQNAMIESAVPMSKGAVFMVTYYPVCKNCMECGTIKIGGVGAQQPVIETYYCQSCQATTYVQFKIEY